MFHLSRVSTNSKVGPIPVSTSSSDNCPPECPFRDSGCYAKSGPLAIHWKAVDAGSRGAKWADFLAQIASLDPGDLWRHNQAGDIAGKGNSINVTRLRQLVATNKKARLMGFTYTHKPVLPSKTVTEGLAKKNARAIKMANEGGLRSTLAPTLCRKPTGWPSWQLAQWWWWSTGAFRRQAPPPRAAR